MRFGQEHPMPCRNTVAPKWVGWRNNTCVAAFNLDWLLSKLPIPDIIKIDVEGAELEVLSNQVRMLNEVRPVIVCEVGSNTADEITKLLTSASYCLFDGEKPLTKAQIVNRATWSTIAIPEEKKHRLP